MTQSLSAEEIAELLAYFGEHGELPHGVEEALLAMASRLVELEAPLDVQFGVDPGDSAALEKLRIAIDDADVWPDEATKEAGNYEAAVAYMAGRSTRLAKIEGAIAHSYKKTSLFPKDAEELLWFAGQLGWPGPTSQAKGG